MIGGCGTSAFADGTFCGTAGSAFVPSCVEAAPEAPLGGTSETTSGFSTGVEGIIGTETRSVAQLDCAGDVVSSCGAGRAVGTGTARRNSARIELMRSLSSIAASLRRCRLSLIDLQQASEQHQHEAACRDPVSPAMRQSVLQIVRNRAPRIEQCGTGTEYNRKRARELNRAKLVRAAPFVNQSDLHDSTFKRVCKESARPRRADRRRRRGDSRLR